MRLAAPMMIAMVVLALGTASNAVYAADLIVTVSNLRSNHGDVHIALYDRPDAFPDSDGMLVEHETPVLQHKARHVFRGLEPGTYAIAIYHDENGNDDFDTNFIGLPLEGYAFSNGATVFLGPPDFDEAAFSVEDAGSKADIVISY